tara:strand:+ start:210 stop:722 length:513 start_codon:yes stop_codon:yes gene_type:complete
MQIKEIESYISKIPDYPKPGILFYDISTLVFDNNAFSSTINKLIDIAKKYEFDLVASIDARGFLFGSVIAHQLNKGLIMVRKKNKLPGKTISYEYELEYGNDTLEINIDAKNKKFLLVDDLLATGGTANAALELLAKAGGQTSCFLSLIELTFLNGRKKISVPMESLIQY